MFIPRISRLILALLLWLVIRPVSSFAFDPMESQPIEGRWDLTVHSPEKDFPSWLEVRHSGLATLVGQFVGASGSARPIAKVEFQGGRFSFSIPPQWEKETNDLKVEGSLQGEQLSGTMVMPNGKQYSWEGKRAPSLKRDKLPTWNQPIQLIQANQLTGWHAMGKNQWLVENGVLHSPASGSNLVTDQLFTDFKLHLEFRYPKESNSGVYLRGRYEVQIADSPPTVDSGLLGGVYGFLTPSEWAGKSAGDWQTYDITLVGRTVTVSLNGKTVICEQQIPGITGGAIDSQEEKPGPLLLQGDHGPIEYRNIVITPAK